MRTSSSIKNIVAALVMNAVVILLSFITQKVFVDILGLQYLGVNGLFTNIISMLGVIEIGLGSAIVYHLYKPLANHDVEHIKSLLRFYKVGYQTIAALVMIIGVALIPIMPTLVGEIDIPINITAVYLLFLVDVVFSYLLAYKRSILYADQKNYLINITHIASTLIMNSLQIAALIITGNFYLYLVIKVAFRILENLAINTWVNRRYGYLNDNRIQPLEDGIRQDIFKKVKALSMHKIGAFIVVGSDIIIISAFLGITTAGLYSNYYLVISAISMLVTQVFTAITASVGNLLIMSNPQKAYKIYSRVRFANFWIATVASVGLLVVMDALIAAWLGIEYILAAGSLLALSINLYLQLSRSSITSFKEAAGIFHEDRYIPVLESLINILLSIIFLRLFGLVGVFIGTICSVLMVHLFSYPKYVYTKLFERGYGTYYLQFVKSLAIATIIGAVTFTLSRMITIENAVLQLVFNTALSLLVPNVILYAIFKDSAEFKYFQHLIVNIVSRKRKLVISEPHPRSRLIIKYALTIMWMIVIFLMSNEIADVSSLRSDDIVRTIQSIGVSAPADLLTFLVRKAAHISAYFVLGILLFNLLKEYDLGVKKMIFASIAIAMLYACTDELHQMYVPGRSGEVRDVLIDTAGAAVGVVVYAARSSRFYKMSEKV